MTDDQQGARVARYAEAIQACYDLDTEVSVQEWDERVARAVMAVADQETAELRTEVDDARQSARTAWDVHSEHVDMMNSRLLHWQSVADDEKRRREAAEAESARLASEQRELAAQVAGLRSVVAAVEALIPTRGQIDQHRRLPWIDHNALRAALASVGVSGSADDRREANASQAPDTATPGEATEPEAQCICWPPNDDEAGHDGDCPKRSRMTAASSADDKAGEQ